MTLRQKIFADEFGRSTLTAEERINSTEADPEKHDKNLRKKLHRAEKSGVKLTDVEGSVDFKVKKEIDERVGGLETRWEGHPSSLDQRETVGR